MSETIWHEYLGRVIRVFSDGELSELEIDGGVVGYIGFSDEIKKYSVYDEVETYGYCDTMIGAIEYYMDIEYKESIEVEVDVPKCRKCGDGGCWYCEPYRFL